MRARRKYTIKRVRGQGVRFACDACDWQVTTLAFDEAVGNLRTQAAAAVNQHIRTAHAFVRVPVKIEDSRI